MNRVILIIILSLLVSDAQIANKRLRKRAWGLWGGGDNNSTTSTVRTTLFFETTSEQISSSTQPSLPTNDLVTEYQSTESLPTKDSITPDDVSSQIPIETTSTQTVETFNHRLTTEENIKQNEIAPSGFREFKIEYDQVVSKCGLVNYFPEIRYLFNSEYLSDFTIITADRSRSIKAHQLILRVKSPIFFNFIANDYSGEFVIKNHDFHLFHDLIKFLYTEEFPIDINTNFQYIKSLYFLAEEFKVNRLNKTIENNLSKILNLNNFKQIFEFAYPNNLTQTTSDWRQFVRQNSGQIFQQKLYLSNNWHTTESVLYNIQMNSSEKMIALDIVRHINGTDMTRFKRLVNDRIEECNAQQLFYFKQLNLLNETQFKQQIIVKTDKLCKMETDLKEKSKQLDGLLRERRTLEQRIHHLADKCDKPVTKMPINRRFVSPYYATQIPYENQFRSSVNSDQDRLPINVNY